MSLKEYFKSAVQASAGSLNILSDFVVPEDIVILNCSMIVTLSHFAKCSLISGLKGRQQTSIDVLSNRKSGVTTPSQKLSANVAFQSWSIKSPMFVPAGHNVNAWIVTNEDADTCHLSMVYISAEEYFS